MNCTLCGNEKDLRVHRAREMMFGFRETFGYLHCPDCGCLALHEVPADMGKYYPPEYYSQDDDATYPWLMRYLLRKRDRFALQGRGLLGRWLNSLLGSQALASLAKLSPAPDTRILDVGCGAGSLLKSLRRMGFTRLQGADPYNRAHIRHDEHLEIHKATINEMKGEWDVIMLHHAFEHLQNPLETLQQIHQRLAPNGTCLLRIPIVPSVVWDEYGVNWVQLDAPRHYYNHSVESIRRLAQSSGFELADVVYDSTGFQFWGSELYARDIPLQQARGFKTFSKLFPMKALREFGRRAEEANAQGRGDQAAFYLKKRKQSEAWTRERQR